MKNYIVIIFGILLLFQYQLINISPIFGYIDEIATIFFGIFFLLHTLKKNKIEKDYFTEIFLIFFIIFIRNNKWVNF